MVLEAASADEDDFDMKSFEGYFNIHFLHSFLIKI